MRKTNDNKVRMDLVDQRAVYEVAKVMTKGAEKYAPWDWVDNVTYSMLVGALLRHLHSFLAVQDTDPETGLHEMAHVMANAMMILGLELRGLRAEKDDIIRQYRGDRPTPDGEDRGVRG